MKLGVNLAYWGLGLSLHDQLAIARAAERLGYDSLWVAEAYGSDAPTVLAWLAAHTSRIRLGSAIFQMPARSPAMTAMTAATLDQLSRGRFTLGLGLSGPQVCEGWHGGPFGRPLTRTREYVEVVRSALRREYVRYDGETITLPRPGGRGKALKLTIGTSQEHIPIQLAAMGPQNVRLAAEIADGWLPLFFSPDHVDELRQPLVEGAARSGRSLEDFAICPTVNVAVTDKIDDGRDRMRDLLALYIGGMGSRERNFYAELAGRYGFAAAADKVQELFLGGRRDDAAAALPVELIDAVTIVGPPGRVGERLQQFARAGVHTLIVSPMALTVEDRIDQLRHIAELAGAALPDLTEQRKNRS